MIDARIDCPAKINVFLAVGRPDSTGYHRIRSIFQAVSLYDTLTIGSSDTDKVTFDLDGIPPENTVTKALDALRLRFELPTIAIHIQKRIPSEAGLGGGSSDAAGLLRWAAAHFDIPPESLTEIASKVGADVPFFLTGGRARVEGYGERITPLPDRPTTAVVIVKPPFGCSTGQMYRDLDAKTYAWREFPDDDEVYNDFERVAPCECGDWIERLHIHGARQAGLSGSGSALFGLFDSMDRAAYASEKLKNENAGEVFVVETLPRFA